MDNCCDMKGFLSFLVLRLINQKNMSGEEIRQELMERKGTRPSPGTIYPVLKLLSEKGLIEEIKDGGREKKYKITRRGVKEVEIANTKFIELFYDMKEEFKRS
ncbi:MAG TPA: PadR family transcriptional regulator [Candidatus Nanoarchaeia archaeon]|nr:PadR family transcriptional regulator [Candidatus Nanoarchaeia archaeon]